MRNHTEFVHFVIVGFLTASACLTGVHARADDYPSRAINFVLPFAPGGGVDLTGRILAQQLSQNLHQSVVVENKPGGAGVVGAQMVSIAKPDGYTLLYSAGANAFLPFTVPNISIDIEHDLTPITQVAKNPYVIIVNKNVPVNNPKELADYIKSHEKDFKWGVSTLGGPDHFAIEQFDYMAGVKPLIVPYTGAGPALVALLGGEVDGVMANPGVAKSNADAGKVKSIAVTTAEPSDLVPGVPTIASFGFAGYDAAGWNALWGPKNMPPALASRIHAYVIQALEDPGLREKFRANILTPAGSASPEAFAAYFHSELAKNGKLVKELNLKPAQ